MGRADDLAPLFNAPDEPGNVTYRQGTVLTWDPTTAQGTIRVGGTGGAVLTNVATFASSEEVGQLSPGDSVGLMVATWGGTSMYFILGRITLPGSPTAASSLALRTQTDSVTNNDGTTSTSYTDLATGGPEVTATVGPTGRALVTVTALFDYSSLNGQAGGYMSFAMSGANTSSASDFRCVKSVLFAQASSGTVNWIAGGRYTAETLLEGLAPGSTTFTAKYKSISGTNTCLFADRVITVAPL